jgi:hypothetical protein
MQTGIIDIACNIFAFEGGKYNFEPLPSVIKHQFSNIVVPTNFVMLEAAKRSDEWVNISDIITDDTIFGSNSSLTPRDVHQPLNNFEQYVVSFINGKRTVRDICKNVFFSRFHVYVAIDKALRNGEIILLNKPDKAPLPSQIKKTPRYKSNRSAISLRKTAMYSVSTTLLFIAILMSILITSKAYNIGAQKSKAEYYLHRNEIESSRKKILTAELLLKTLRGPDSGITGKTLVDEGIVELRDLKNARKAKEN